MSELSQPSQRRILTIGEKKEIIKLLENGETHKSIAKKFNIGRSTVTKLNNIKNKYNHGEIGNIFDFKKRLRTGKHDIVEFELLKWINEESQRTYNFNNIISNNTNNLSYNSRPVVTITAQDILCKANEISIKLGLGDFGEGNQWLSRFKRKFKLDFEIRKKGLSNKDNKSYRNPSHCELSEFKSSIKNTNDFEVGNPNQIKSDYIDNFVTWDKILDKSFLSNNIFDQGSNSNTNFINECHPIFNKHFEFNNEVENENEEFKFLTETINNPKRNSISFPFQNTYVEEIYFRDIYNPNIDYDSIAQLLGLDKINNQWE